LDAQICALRVGKKGPRRFLDWSVGNFDAHHGEAGSMQAAEGHLVASSGKKAQRRDGGGGSGGGEVPAPCWANAAS